MIWKIRVSERVVKALKKIDKTNSKRILDYLDQVAMLDNPKRRGKSLTGSKAGLWRYRVGDYRIICEIKQKQIVIVILLIGHRKDIYD